MFDVAVIIPTHNRARLIGEAVASVLGQSGGMKIEVAIVDDGSTDGTAAVVEPLVRGHGEPGGRVAVRYIAQAKQGVVAARNRGIAETAAPLVAFLDSDDFWDPRKLEEQVAAMGRGADVGVVHTSFRYVDEAGRVTDAGAQRVDNPCAGRCLRTLLREDLVVFSSVLMRRGVIERAAREETHGLAFDPRWVNAQDYDLLLRAARHCGFAYLAEPLTSYRVHPGHAAMGNLPRAFGFHCRVQMDFVKRHGEAEGLTEADGRAAAREFLRGRAEAMYWRRELETGRKLCALAGELGVRDGSFDGLERRLGRQRWVLRVKDAVDRVRGRGRG